MLGSNAGMRRASQAAGFSLRQMPGDAGVMLAELDLSHRP
jgi:hypothetical protein